MFIVVGAGSMGDENAEVISFGKLENGKTGNVGPGSDPHEMSETANQTDRAFWLSLKGNESKAKQHTIRIPASSKTIREYANSLVENTTYQPADSMTLNRLGSIFTIGFKPISERAVTTNSNAAAWAVANRAASHGKPNEVVIPLPDPTRLEPQSLMWRHIEFNNK